MFAIEARNKPHLQAEKAIDIIAGLTENWNCNGAPAIPSDVVERARDILAVYSDKIDHCVPQKLPTHGDRIDHPVRLKLATLCDKSGPQL